MVSKFHDFSGLSQGSLTTFFLLGGAVVLLLYAFLGYLRWRDRKKHTHKKPIRNPREVSVRSVPVKSLSVLSCGEPH